MTESLHDPLVLELKLPELETPVSQQVFLEALSKQLPHFVSWFISFAILCRLWIAQHALLEQGEQGVRVKILTNSLSSTDVAVVHAGYSKYRKDLLRMGVELYELNKHLTKKERKEMKKGGVGRSTASLHAKSFVFDRERIFIGSFNLDAQSRIQNTEIGVVFESADIASRMAKGFDQNIDQAAFRLELKTYENGSEQILWHGLVDGEQRVLKKDPYTGFWKRFGVGFMSLLPIESQL